MHKSPNNLLSRRALIAGVTGFSLRQRSFPINARQVEESSLGNGLIIQDYRLFPTRDVLRFIVEIHNSSDRAIDTPTVGVILPHLDASMNFGWANPISMVLHPHTSDCLIGVAPGGMRSDNDWDAPKWFLCSNLTDESVKLLDPWNIDYAHTIEYPEPQHAAITIELLNHSSEKPRNIVLQGMVRDKGGRVCGSAVPRGISLALPGESVSIPANLRPDLNYISNPFILIDNVYGIDVEYTLQPRPRPVNPNCPPVLPWNQL